METFRHLLSHVSFRTRAQNLRSGAFFALLFVLIPLLAEPSFAKVDMKNGNYTQDWTDVPGYLVRTYNSRCINKGMFGVGWSSDFDTHFVVSGANLVRSAGGCGQETVYALSPESEVQLAKMGLSLKDILVAPPYPAGERVPIVRIEKLNGQELHFLPFNDGRQTSEVLAVNKDGFFLKSEDYGSEAYSLGGNLLRGQVLTLDGSWVTFKQGFTVNWKNSRQISSVTFPENFMVLTFSYPNAKEADLDTVINGKSARIVYQFNERGDTVGVTAGNGEVTRFEYDNLSNIIQITWPDKTTNLLVYDNAHDWVKMFKSRDDCIETYEYPENPADPHNDYGSEVTKTCNDKIVAHRYWHFLSATNSAGLNHLSQVEEISESDGEVQHTIANYDDNGRLINKSNRNGSGSFHYGQNQIAIFDNENRLYSEPVFVVPDGSVTMVLASDKSSLKPMAMAKYPPASCGGNGVIPDPCSYRKIVEKFLVTDSIDALQGSKLDGIAVKNHQLIGIRTGGVIYTVTHDPQSGTVRISGGTIQSPTTIPELAHQLSNTDFEKISEVLNYGGKRLLVNTLMTRQEQASR
jgi:YD repeat-containing protein